MPRSFLSMAAVIGVVLSTLAGGSRPREATGAVLVQDSFYIGDKISGFRETPASSGVVGQGAWSDEGWGFRIAWDITVEGSVEAPLYAYKYLLTGSVEVPDDPLTPQNKSNLITTRDGDAFIPLQQGLSHLILEVTDFQGDQVWDGAPYSARYLDLVSGVYDWVELGSDLTTEGPGIFATSGGETLPGEIYGVRFEGPGPGGPDLTVVEISFLSNQAPVWGHFWAKDGVSKDVNGEDVENLAWNVALDENALAEFGLAAGLQPDDMDSKTYWIARPDGGTSPNILGGQVPEPASIVIWGLLGLGSAAGALSRRKRKQSGS